MEKTPILCCCNKSTREAMEARNPEAADGRMEGAFTSQQAFTREAPTAAQHRVPRLGPNHQPHATVAAGHALARTLKRRRSDPEANDGSCNLRDAAATPGTATTAAAAGGPTFSNLRPENTGPGPSDDVTDDAASARGGNGGVITLTAGQVCCKAAVQPPNLTPHRGAAQQQNQNQKQRGQHRHTPIQRSNASAGGGRDPKLRQRREAAVAVAVSTAAPPRTFQLAPPDVLAALGSFAGELVRTQALPGLRALRPPPTATTTSGCSGGIATMEQLQAWLDKHLAALSAAAAGRTARAGAVEGAAVPKECAVPPPAAPRAAAAQPAVVLDLQGATLRSGGQGGQGGLQVRVVGGRCSSNGGRACDCSGREGGGAVIIIRNGRLDASCKVLVEGGAQVIFQDVVISRPSWGGTASVADAATGAGGTAGVALAAASPASEDVDGDIAAGSRSSSSGGNGGGSDASQQGWDAVVVVRGVGSYVRLKNCTVMVREQKKGTPAQATGAGGLAAMAAGNGSNATAPALAQHSVRAGCVLALEGGCAELSGRCEISGGPYFGLAAVGPGSCVRAELVTVQGTSSTAGFLAAYGGELQAVKCSALRCGGGVGSGGGGDTPGNLLLTAQGFIAAGVGYAAVDGSRLVTSQCVASQCAYSGFLAAGSGTELVSIGGCRAEENGWGGFLSIHSAVLRVGPGCCALSNGSFGFVADSGAVLTAGEGCTAEDHGNEGWLGSREAVVVAGRNSRAVRNGGGGFASRLDSLLFAGECCVAEGNGADGWSAQDSSQLVLAGGCRAVGNGGAGFTAVGLASERLPCARLQAGPRCTAERNAWQGFAAVQYGTVMVGVGGAALGNGLAGFAASCGGRLAVDGGGGCASEGNRRHGFSCDGSDSLLLVGPGCRAVGNQGWGALVSGSGAEMRVCQEGWAGETHQAEGRDDGSSAALFATGCRVVMGGSRALGALKLWVAFGIAALSQIA
ncbi:hypothetical protein VOLCADRAFT_88160 [Volvox carteri f. nagariensis]|uniref:Uncharacterized protein n=1 Tax=Volvox carteri f. nagariensis TaxID=3068 RepID=D8TNF8_VOLCA|nr:uncharacterized protein VOLCADRAFT_88160 [Volvox carteri f. nagariensis]EFJ50834.1 hypothetical protein VOLCADRAFT_88160 [Volvox carteri f. nagariensis]|eukprot:XP_002947846.1 hypothetical protein VOLCADRAFT_88160 [Volvox carteri f. nagariensis]